MRWKTCKGILVSIDIASATFGNIEESLWIPRAFNNTSSNSAISKGIRSPVCDWNGTISNKKPVPNTETLETYLKSGPKGYTPNLSRQ